MTSLLHFFPRSPEEEEEEEEPSIQSLDIEKHRTHSLTQAMKKRGRSADGREKNKNDEDEEAFPRGNFVDDERDEEHVEEEQNERSRRASRTKTTTTATERFAAISKDSSLSLKGRKAGGKGSSGKYIEALKWKTLRRGVKLLGIVSHVSNKGLIVSLQNGLKGTVSKSEASDAFYITNKDRVKRKSKKKPSSYSSSRQKLPSNLWLHRQRCIPSRLR